MKFNLFFSFLLCAFCSQAQQVRPANVYPSNLEENMYFNSFDQQTNEIKGLHFYVLSDGEMSGDRTPAFEVTIYLMPEGKSSREDLIVAKVYQLDGIFHMGKHEFENETVDLKNVKDLKPGRYRVGIWVNSNRAFEENTNDNATLFRDAIEITQILNKPNVQKKSSNWDDDDWDDDDDDWDDSL